MNQQEYLTEAYKRFRENVLPGAPPVEGVLLTYGFPSARAKSKNPVVGECFYNVKEACGQSGIEGKYVSVIFISPVTWDSEDDVLGTLMHEMVHAATPGSRHKGKFVDVAIAIGLEGPPKSCGPGKLLAEKLKGLMAGVEFPAAKVKLETYVKKGSRLRLYECSCEKPIKVRVASDEFSATCKKCEQDFVKQVVDEFDNTRPGD